MDKGRRFGYLTLGYRWQEVKCNGEKHVALYPPDRFNVLSLCSGIGGLDLGVRLALPAMR